MSWLESSDDQRDKTLGLAGLLAGIHSLRILAERGLAEPHDIQVAVDGMKSVLAQIPAGSMDAGQLGNLEALIDSLVMAAHNARRNTDG